MEEKKATGHTNTREPGRTTGRDTTAKTKVDEDIPLSQISDLCLPQPRYVKRLGRFGLRPERPDPTALISIEPVVHWTRALQYIQACIRNEGQFSLRRLSSIYSRPDLLARGLLQMVTAILYDQECSGVIEDELAEPPSARLESKRLVRTSSGRVGVIRHNSLARRMLEIDYDVPATPEWGIRAKDVSKFEDHCEFLVDVARHCKQGRFPDQEVWDTLYRHVGSCTGTLPDLAIMYYYYHTHKRPLDPKDFSKSGVVDIGYTGILPELIAEIPTRGTTRLARKLSVDVNDMIREYAHDDAQGSALVAAAEAVAEKYGIPIYRLPDGTETAKHPPGSSPGSPNKFLDFYGTICVTFGDASEGLWGIPGKDPLF